jgi:hypothetical protein
MVETRKLAAILAADDTGHGVRADEVVALFRQRVPTKDVVRMGSRA